MVVANQSARTSARTSRNHTAAEHAPPGQQTGVRERDNRQSERASPNIDSGERLAVAVAVAFVVSQGGGHADDTAGGGCSQ